MEPEEAEEVKELLQYPPDTAGGIMSPDFIAVKETMTVSQVIEMLRERADVESIFYVYVVDDEGTLKGVLNLRRLIVSPPDTQISEIMNHGVIFVFPELEKKRPTEIARLRLPWLTITVCIELIAGFVIHRFDKTLGQLILLASFMPVIQAISGNTGLQSATIVVRGLATGHVTLRDWIRPVVRQLQTTTILGIILGSALFSIAGFWRGLQAGTTLFDPVFGFVVGFSMFITINLSGFVGTVVPMISKRLGFDPALTAGPFETAIQDVVSVTILLGLATLLLRFMA
jgi:magnesium transporter